ncbi:hypothetical protein ABZX95_17160 [Streptomyces sp. NPDC004232]|uniref:hypothetical protein n=1 Tax=Streptomyces sp. NPDC004232 TaxID=3154454 RepID=UPI00339EBC6B
MKGLLRRIARRCDIHDRSSPLRIAELERDLGYDPRAVDKLKARRAAGDSTALFIDNALIDCGRDWCRTRRTP